MIPAMYHQVQGLRMKIGMYDSSYVSPSTGFTNEDNHV